MSKAEEQALIRFPEQMTPLVYQELIDQFGGKTEIDFNLLPRSYFQLGYEQAEKDLGWISVKDRLPGPSEWVVVCIEQHGHAQCLALATYNHETKGWHTAEFEDGEQETVYVDYWMPIPNIIKDGKY